MTTAIPLFKKRWREYLEENGEQNNTAIVFPDEGASKRFGNLFSNDFDIIVCSKIRHNDERIVTIREGDPRGKHVIIVDDLVQTGKLITAWKQ